MKKRHLTLLKAFLVVFLLTGSWNAFAWEIFRGQGNCYIETHPCEDGRPISCMAEGPYGGYCLANVVGNNDQFYEVECVANGGYGTPRRTATRRCYRENRSRSQFPTDRPFGR